MNKLLKITLFLLLISSPVSAQTLHGTFVDWSVFSTKYGKKEVCYMASLPIKKDGNYDKRGEPYFLVTNIDQNYEEISISSGYYYKENTEAELSFGLKKIKIFTYKNLAWGHDSTDDIEIMKEMRRGSSVIVTGKSINNTYSKDTYSLIGFVEAYKKMKKVCNNKETELENSK